LRFLKRANLSGPHGGARKAGLDASTRLLRSLAQHEGSRLLQQNQSRAPRAEFVARSFGRGIGVTFQQVQKYENGSNRVSVSKLHAIAAALAGCDRAPKEDASSGEPD
jgi:transcriptional regulator with XRE-family HTH domain